MQEAKKTELVARPAGEQALLDQLLDQAKRVADPSSDGWRYGLEPRTNDELERFAKWVAESGFRKDLKSPGAAAILIAAGRVQGLGVFAALECFDVVFGRPFLRGKAARAFLLRSPLVEAFEIVEDPDDQDPPTKAVIEVSRRGWRGPKRVTFTLDEAKRLGLLDRKKDDGSTAQTGWHTQPGVMLIERCTTKCIRRHFPDLLLGLGLEDEEDLEPKPKVVSAEVVEEAKPGASLNDVVNAAAPKKKRPEPASKPAQAAPAAQGAKSEPTPKERIIAAWEAVKTALGPELGEEVWRAQMPEEDLAVLAPDAKPTLKRFLECVEVAEILAKRVRTAAEVNVLRANLESEGGPKAVYLEGPGSWALLDLEKLEQAARKQLEALRANKEG